MAKSKLVKANEKIAEKVVGGYKKIEDTVVGGYRKVENAFVDRYLTHDGESVEEAKERLHTRQAERQARAQEQRSDGSDYAQKSWAHTMEHVKRAQEMAHVPNCNK
jgi:hypothetical protein